MKTFLCLFALAVFAFAAPDEINVAGKWTGSFNITAPDGTVNDGGAVMVIKQSGSELTGTAGPDEDQQFPIAKGRIEGDKVTLEVHRAEDQVIKITMVLANDRMKGDAILNMNGESRTAKVDIGRAK